LINNPANPSGSNFSRDHVAKICATATKYQIPLISDEIYAGMTFNGTVFTSVSNFPDTPALIIAGLAKSFVVPGWRLGWIIKHDAVHKVLDRIWAGCNALTQIIIGPNTLVQAALPAILDNKNTKVYREELTKTIGKQSELCYELLTKAEGLTPIRPDGAMYMLVGIEIDKYDASWGVTDDIAFSQQLMKEENVQVLPGTIFNIPGFVRIVVTKPPEQLKEAIERIVAFVAKLKIKKP
jgi:tyrosine aminotransferase